MMWEIYRVTGLDLDGCRSELILGALATLASIDFGAEDIGKAFATHASRTAWELGLGNMRALVELGWNGDELLSMPDEMPLPPKKIERILDPRKYLPTPEQLAGERFGAIAAKLGMIDALHEPDRENRCATSRAAPLDFIKLFGMAPTTPIPHDGSARGIGSGSAWGVCRVISATASPATSLWRYVR
jgi:hypothetical protein